MDAVPNLYLYTLSHAYTSEAPSDTFYYLSLHDALPITTTPSQGTCTTTTGQNFSCSLGTIPAGGSATVTRSEERRVGKECRPQSNTVNDKSKKPDTVTGKNTASDNNTVATSAELAVTKTDGVTTVIAGDGVTRTYTITVSNIAGPSDATGVTLSDAVTGGFTRGMTIPSQGTCTTTTGQNFSCSLGTIPAGGSATVT